MKPPVFEYCRVSHIDEAVYQLSQRGSEAKILAGGQSLIPMMKLRLARPSMLIDINPIKEAAYMHVSDGWMAIGATRRFSTLETAEVEQACPLLRDAIGYVGHEAIRNRGTLCGSISHADPAAEMPVVSCCVNAQMLTTGPTGTRTISASEFFTSFLTTSLNEDELLAEVRVPVLNGNTGWAFQEVSRRHAKFGLVAVTLERDANDRVKRASIAIGGVAERPVRAVEAEAALEGEGGGSGTFRAAAAEATAELDPPSDVHGSGSFRKKVAEVLVERALLDAWQRARTPH
jgi:aerobic carbon-monoxide dehydrogenase medium subunit